MSSSKPCLASRPRAFMMFHTSGVNTGSVRLETVIFGRCCAGEGLVPSSARRQAAARVARPRRKNIVMEFPSWSFLPAFQGVGVLAVFQSSRGEKVLARYRIDADQSAG